MAQQNKLSVDYSSVPIPGKLMKHRKTGNILPAIERLVQDTDNEEASYILLSKEDADKELANILQSAGLSIDVSQPQKQIAEPTPIAVLPDGLFDLFCSANKAELGKLKKDNDLDDALIYEKISALCAMPEPYPTLIAVELAKRWLHNEETIKA